MEEAQRLRPGAVIIHTHSDVLREAHFWFRCVLEHSGAVPVPLLLMAKPILQDGAAAVTDAAAGGRCAPQHDTGYASRCACDGARARACLGCHVSLFTNSVPISGLDDLVPR